MTLTIYADLKADGSLSPDCRPFGLWFPEKTSCGTYLQWDTILAKLQGRGQGADHHIPPELVLADLTTHGHVHTHAVCHSAKPNILQRQS